MKDRRVFFNPAKFPFFYGYAIVLFATLGIWSSLPGQTVGVSTFTDPVIKSLQLNRDLFSTAYMAGTLLSSFFISAAGRWFDKYGARKVAFASAMVLSLSLFVASYSHIISGSIQSALSFEHWSIPFSVITLLFFLFRFSGQGVLTLSSRNMVMKWFDRYRGKVNAFTALSVALGFSISPLLIDKLIQTYQWDGAWRIMGATLLIMAIVILVFYRDNPEQYGLKPDGGKINSDDDNKREKKDRDFTPSEAFATRVFWIYSLMLAYNSFFITGFTFHVVSVFESVGYERSQAISIFVPLSVVSVIVSLTFNFLSDKIYLKTLLYIMIGGGFIAAAGLTMLSISYGIYMIIVGLGISGGLFSVLNAVAWPRLFGRKHLGAVSGKAMSMVVFASALAPILFSLSYTRLDTYSAVGLVAFVFMIFMLVGALRANNPRLLQN
ncbi:MFS transporter [Marinilabiliaceae bacterium ANBcel2]|nr:MFS transporter [Marinilabiliaceae bacterium ANBcel2]